MAVIVADTDVLVDYLAGQGVVSETVGEHLTRGRLATTVVTRYELLAGATGARAERAVRKLLDALPALALDGEAADRAAQVRRSLERRGEPIGMADSLIAGIVLTHGGELLTRNRRHFGRVDGLRLSVL